MNNLIEIQTYKQSNYHKHSLMDLMDFIEDNQNDFDEEQNFINMTQYFEKQYEENQSFKLLLKRFRHSFEKRQTILIIHQPLITSEFNLAIEIEINYKKGNIIAIGRLQGKFGMPYLVIQKNLRIQLCRYFLRLNAIQRYGSFYISPNHGDICFKVYQKLNTNISDWINQDLIKNIETAFIVIEQRFKGQMYRFLIALNKTDIQTYNKMEKYAEKSNINLNLKQFMPGALELLESIRIIAEEKCQTAFTKEIQEEHQAIFNIQKTPNQIKLYNSIVFQDKGSAKKVNEGMSGGFANVYKAEICFKDVESSAQNYQKRTVAMKQSKNQQNSIKIQHEIKIMEQLSKYGSSPFIAQCYHNQDEPSIFYMEYYLHSSLDIFKQKFEQIMSLNTKLFILYNIGMGIKFLHDSKVIHMDLKPQNIFISKSYIAKLGDFGEAKSSDFTQLVSSGKTYPFCAPEGIERASTNYDIFSYGLIIIELIFDRYPIDFQIRNLDNLVKSYESKSYRIQYNSYQIKKFPQKLFQYLYLIAYKCLDPIPENRPKIEWIIVALRKAIQYIDKVY